jgi:hypothetical protein
LVANAKKVWTLPDIFGYPTGAVSVPIESERKLQLLF